MKKVGVAILGHGTIGGGVSRILISDKDSIAKKNNVDLELRAICDTDPEKDTEFFGEFPKIFKKFSEIINDPKIEIIVETIGGNGIAREFVEKALQKGKNIVTANKEMISKNFLNLQNLTEKNNRKILFEAAVGGGIPILSSILSGICGDQIWQIDGILNGTTNFIISEMEKSGEDFSKILKIAQDKGYAEGNPANDIDGIDAAHKLSILIALAFGKYFPPEEIKTTGISKLQKYDFWYAEKLDKKIKLIATTKKINGKIMAKVSPTLISKKYRISKIDGVLNALNLNGIYNPIGNFLSGEGAGRFPTAAAIVSDVINIATDRAPKIPKLEKAEILSNEEIEFFIRFLVFDRPGILGKIGSIFEKFKISINSVEQLPINENPLPFAVTTKKTNSENFNAAIEEIKKLDFNAQSPMFCEMRE